MENYKVLCPICLLGFDEAVRAPYKIESIRCAHSYCADCLTKALKIKMECPLCRRKCKTAKIIKNEDLIYEWMGLDFWQRHYHVLRSEYVFEWKALKGIVDRYNDTTRDWNELMKNEEGASQKFIEMEFEFPEIDATKQKFRPRKTKNWQQKEVWAWSLHVQWKTEEMKENLENLKQRSTELKHKRLMTELMATVVPSIRKLDYSQMTSQSTEVSRLMEMI